MTTIELTLPDSIYKQMQKVAKTNQKEISDIVVQLFETIYPTNTDSSDGDYEEALDKLADREISAYHQCHPTLVEKHLGDFVAFYQGNLIDHDSDRWELGKRVKKLYSDTFVLIRQVEEDPEPIIYSRSLRFVQD